MFAGRNKELYVNSEHPPISVSGTNTSPYMQEMLFFEEKRRNKHSEETYNRRHGFIQ